MVFFNSNSFAIYGGTPTDQSLLTSFVNIKFQKGMCSGTLIAPNVVITAAHCKDMHKTPELVAITNLEERPTLKCNISNVVETAYVPGAEPILPRNVHAPDLLLMKLESPLCSGTPVSISNQAINVGDTLFHTGYGGGSGSLYENFEISLEIINSEGVEQFNTNTLPIALDLLELGRDYYSFALPTEKNSSACGGDSGGPFYVLDKKGDMILKGINGAVFGHDVLGAGNCRNGYLHMISPIYPYYDWIQSKIIEWSSDSKKIS